MSDLALRGTGALGLLPDHDVVIFDEAHGLADVGANLLGLRVVSGAIANLLNHLYNERSKSGLLAHHGLPDLQSQVRRTLAATDSFFDAAANWPSRSGSSNGRAREKTSLPESLVEDLRKLATAIGHAIEPCSPRSSGSSLNLCRREAGRLQRTWPAG